MNTIFLKLKSWITDTFGSLTICHGKTWMTLLWKEPGSATDKEPNNLEDPEACSDTCYATGIRHLLNLSPSSFKSNSQSTSRDSSVDTVLQASTNYQQDTPLWKNKHMNPTFYADSQKLTSNAQMEYWKTFQSP